MTPTLTRRGRLIAGAAALFVAAGALRSAWPLIALGTVVTSALATAYLVYYQTAILLRRRKVELAWWVPPGDQPGGALTVDHPFQLHVATRNHGRRKLRVQSIRPLATTALEVQADPPPGAHVPGGTEVETLVPLTARAAGYLALHGAALLLVDPLGLFELSAYFPNPLVLKVFPRLAATRGAGLPSRPEVGALHERAGVHPVRRRGLAGELREIRDHAHGDPFKFIAWKPTARRRRLMVRELESEIVLTHQLLVDVAGSMRGGTPGRTKLDYAVETAAALARASLEGGDRVGLVTFDARVYGQLKPDEGRPHYLRVVERLLETRNVVDEDLTDLTDGELVAATARYVAHQEGVDVRLRAAPPVDDPAWSRIATGPAGELYDLASLGRVVSSLLKAEHAQQKARRSRSPAGWWSRVLISDETDPEMARLRLFCRLRGVELPYRAVHPAGRRAAGLAEALRRATTGERAHMLVLVSDLEGVLEDPATVLAALALARRRRHHVVAVAPFGPDFAPPAATSAGRRVADVLSRDERRRLEAGRAHLVRAGVPVLVAGPEDTALVLARRATRARALLRGRA